MSNGKNKLFLKIIAIILALLMVSSVGVTMIMALLLR